MYGQNVSPHIFQGDVVQPFAAVGAAGAVSQKSGILYVTATGVIALTIADPVSGDPMHGGDDGKELTVIDTTGHAHTLDNSAGSGFNAGGAGTDVGTFGGAKGDNITIVAYGGKWYVKRLVNVTLG